MEEPAGEDLGQWLAERCQKERLSLRQAATKTGLSHATIGDIIKGGHASPSTISKLAAAFGGDGDHQRRALEDELLILGGYRTRPPAGQEPSQPLARLMDLVSEFNEPQLKLMLLLAQFLGEMQKDINIGGKNTGKEVKDFFSRVKIKGV